jgi:hypothetical protein
MLSSERQGDVDHAFFCSSGSIRSESQVNLMTSNSRTGLEVSGSGSGSGSGSKGRELKSKQVIDELVLLLGLQATSYKCRSCQQSQVQRGL